MKQPQRPAPAPVTPLFAPVCLLPRFARFIVRETGEGYIVFDCLFGQMVGNPHDNSEAAEEAAATWGDFAQRKAAA